MAEKGDIDLIITLDDGSVVKGLAVAEKRSEQSADKIEGNISDGLRRGFRVAATAAAAAFTAAAAAAAVVFSKGIDAAKIQEDAVSQLNQSLKSAGTFTEEASLSLQRYAATIEDTTRLGDEFVIQQLALARGFARSNEEAERLVGAAIELSAFTGGDLRQSVINIGKTFNGLVGELGETVGSVRTLTKEQLQSGAAIDLGQHHPGQCRQGHRHF